MLGHPTLRSPGVRRPARHDDAITEANEADTAS